jgi:TolB-like protein
MPSQEMSDREITADLHSDFLPKTSVQKRGKQIRINAQLVFA